MGEGVKNGYIGRGAECTCIKVKYEILAMYKSTKSMKHIKWTYRFPGQSEQGGRRVSHEFRREFSAPEMALDITNIKHVIHHLEKFL